MATYVPNSGKKDFLNRHNIKSNCNFIEKVGGWGYGQVEPNHLAGQATKEVYAQLPAASSIAMLENGQFAKYDYANNQVNFTGAGEWMLVWNEVKLYRDEMTEAEFALKQDDFVARIYSPFGGNGFDDDWGKQSRFYGASAEGSSANGNVSAISFANGQVSFGSGDDARSFPVDTVVASNDPYEMNATQDPFHIVANSNHNARKMSDLGSVGSMVPRLMKTYVGDIMTTNMLNVPADTVMNEQAFKSFLGLKFAPNAQGILTYVAEADAADKEMLWQVVKCYTMPDHQPGMKVMRIK